MADLYRKIREAERRNDAMNMWLVQLHFMVSGQMKYQSFSEYYDRLTGKDLDLRSDAEILAEVEAIRKEMKEG